jgi:hypothetical protein
MLLLRWSQLPDLGFLAGLALHSVVAPNEEVANKISTTFTRESMPRLTSESNRIPSLFFRIRQNSFGVQNGVHFGVGFGILITT